MVWWLKVRYNISRTTLSKLNRLAYLAITGVMKMTPTAAMEVLQGCLFFTWWWRWRPRQGSTDYSVPNTGDLNPLTTVTPKNLGIWSMNPSYGWGLTGCNWDMHTANHSQPSPLTSVNGRMSSTQTEKGTWSGIRMVPRPIKGLVLGCTDGAQERPTAPVLGSTPWYSRLKHMPLKYRYGECRKGLHR